MGGRIWSISLLALVQWQMDVSGVREHRRELLMTRAMGIPDPENATGKRWRLDHHFLDHHFLDQDGMPTFVEVKRAVDTRPRALATGRMPFTRPIWTDP